MTGLKRTCLLLAGLAALTGLSFAARGAEKRVDVRKKIVERPLERIVASAAAAKKSEAKKSDNPKVAPGKVRWHADFETACAAARNSTKPVLLFQMLGNLDDRFC